MSPLPEIFKYMDKHSLSQKKCGCEIYDTLIFYLQEDLLELCAWGGVFLSLFNRHIWKAAQELEKLNSN